MLTYSVNIVSVIARAEERIKGEEDKDSRSEKEVKAEDKITHTKNRATRVRAPGQVRGMEHLFNAKRSV